MHLKTPLTLSIVSIVLVLFSLNYSSLATETEEIDKKLHTSCLYPTINISSSMNFGSGVITRSIKIDEENYLNIFISCNHIIMAGMREKYQVTVYEYTDWSTVSKTRKYKCFFYSSSSDEDLCVGAFLSETKMPTAEVDMSPKFYIHNKLLSIGCGLGDFPRVEDGRITAPISSANLGDNKVKASMHLTPGDSGGPVFMNYKVVGINHAIRNYRGQLVFMTSYFTSTTQLKKWDDSNNHSYSFSWTQDEEWPKLIYNKLKLLKDFEISK